MGPEHLLQITLCFALGFFFCLFVYVKSGWFRVALLVPTRGHGFAAQRVFAPEKSLQASSALQPQLPGFLPMGSRVSAEKQAVSV